MFPQKWTEEVEKKVEDRTFWTKRGRLLVKIIIISIYWALMCQTLCSTLYSLSHLIFTPTYDMCYSSHLLISNWNVERWNNLPGTQLIRHKTLAETQVCLISEPKLWTTIFFLKKVINTVKLSIQVKEWLAGWRMGHQESSWIYSFGCLLTKKRNFSSDVVVGVGIVASIAAFQLL